jgi:hypothetical protein
MRATSLFAFQSTYVPEQLTYKQMSCHGVFTCWVARLHLKTRKKRSISTNFWCELGDFIHTMREMS